MDKAAASASASARFRTTVLMNLASVVEKADEQVLPAVYYFVGRSLNATPAQLGTLTLCRALVQVHSTALVHLCSRVTMHLPPPLNCLKAGIL